MTTIPCPKCDEKFKSLDDLWNHVPVCQAKQAEQAKLAELAKLAEQPEPNPCIYEAQGCGFKHHDDFHLYLHMCRCPCKPGASAPAPVAKTFEPVQPPAVKPAVKPKQVVTIDDLRAGLVEMQAGFKEHHKKAEAKAEEKAKADEAKAEDAAAGAAVEPTPPTAGGKATKTKTRTVPYEKPAAASKSAAKPPPSALQTQYTKGGSTYRTEFKKLKEEHGKQPKMSSKDAEIFRQNTLDVILKVDANDVNNFVAQQGESGSLGASAFIEYVETIKTPKQLADITSLAEADQVGFFRGVDAITNQLSKRRSEAKKLAAPEGGAPAASPSQAAKAPEVKRADITNDARKLFRSYPWLVEKGWLAARAVFVGVYGSVYGPIEEGHATEELVKKAYEDVFVLKPTSASATLSTIPVAGSTAAGSPAAGSTKRVQEPMNPAKIEAYIRHYLQQLSEEELAKTTMRGVRARVAEHFTIDPETMDTFRQVIKETVDKTMPSLSPEAAASAAVVPTPSTGGDKKRELDAETKCKGNLAPRKGIRKPSKRSQQAGDPAKVKKPLTGFMLFAQQKRPEVRAEHPEAGLTALAKILGAMWGRLSDPQKELWKQGTIPSQEGAGAGQGVAADVVQPRSPSTPLPSSPSEDGHDPCLCALARVEMDYESSESE